MRNTTVAVAAFLLLTAAGAWADTAPVRTRTGNVYDAAVEGSKVIVTLPQGTWLEILSEKPGWAKVRLADGRTGWVRSSTLDPAQRRPGSLDGTGGTGGTDGAGTTGSGTPSATTTRPPAGGGASSAGAPKSVQSTGESGGQDFWSKMGGGGSQDQAAAAGKGFNEEIERNYRQSNPNLEPCYRLIDERILQLDYNRPAVLEKFRRQGSLGEFARNP